ncbi:hypothetical protein AK812_SmicGene13189 [Symbiodinium microadriaticum]|uniref:Uncharacterized protein n=1 Tax=Symbiodinium microadriaticum TaxID=2951 RepID=A0A1Q9E8P5_SYMMI|nr:hypothetical protein AK812_SmicGene13189 [Symbiodinium microadriaticum]
MLEYVLIEPVVSQYYIIYHAAAAAAAAFAASKALYSAYGYSEHQIAVCSCGIGSLADRFGLLAASADRLSLEVLSFCIWGDLERGRKRCCLAYCVFHAFAAMSPLDRECWMVSEHTARHKFSANLLAYTFSQQLRDGIASVDIYYGKLLMWDAVNLLIQGSMYVFVSNWTPALESEDTSPPHGLVFSLFMLAATCGSSAARTVKGLKAATLGGRFISASASLSLDNETWVWDTPVRGVGWYFPCVGIAKSEIVRQSEGAI